MTLEGIAASSDKTHREAMSEQSRIPQPLVCSHQQYLNGCSGKLC